MCCAVFLFQINRPVLWLILRKFVNTSSFSSTIGNDEVVFWHLGFLEQFFEAFRFASFANDKPWQFVTIHICSSNVWQSYFAMFASGAFLVFEIKGFLT